MQVKGPLVPKRQDEMTIRKLLLGTAAALMLAIGPAHATQDCATDGDTVTLHGTIVQSSGAAEGTGKPEKFMAIALNVPLCTDLTDHAETLVEVSPVSMKWLGHYVVVTGIVGPSGFGP